LQGCEPKGKLGVTQHTPGSVRRCEGMNPHTPREFHFRSWNPGGSSILGVGVPVGVPF